MFAACLEALGPAPFAAVQVRQLHEALFNIKKFAAKPPGGAGLSKSPLADDAAPGVAMHFAAGSAPQLQSADNPLTQKESPCGSACQPTNAENFTLETQVTESSLSDSQPKNASFL